MFSIRPTQEETSPRLYGPTRQHELDHTNQKSIYLERSRSWSRNRLICPRRENISKRLHRHAFLSSTEHRFCTTRNACHEKGSHAMVSPFLLYCRGGVATVLVWSFLLEDENLPFRSDYSSWNRNTSPPSQKHLERQGCASMIPTRVSGQQ